MNILVTGCNSQLGLCLRDICPTSSHNYIFKSHSELDITDALRVSGCISDNNIGIIVNCASFNDVNGAENNTALASATNIRGAEVLSCAAAKHNALLIHISSDYVFGNLYRRPHTESDTTSPLNVYGRTKLDGEKAIQSTTQEYIIIRTSWMYSEYGNNFVKTILSKLHSMDSFSVVSDQYGTPTYAGDLARVVFDIIENSKWQGNSGIYHYSHEGCCSWFDFATMIAKHTSHTMCHIHPCLSEDFPSPAIRPAYSVLDKTKIKMTFGITIPRWEEALTTFLQRHNL